MEVLVAFSTPSTTLIKNAGRLVMRTRAHHATVSFTSPSYSPSSQVISYLPCCAVSGSRNGGGLALDLA